MTTAIYETRPVDELPTNDRRGRNSGPKTIAFEELPAGIAIFFPATSAGFASAWARKFPGRQVHTRRRDDGVWFWWEPKE